MLRRVVGLLAVASLGLLVAGGCGGGSGKIYKTSGVLLWEDGTPVEDANIVLVPVDTKGRTASALTGKDGTFDLTTKNSGDGAQAGEYKVTVTRPDMVEGMPPSKQGDDPTKAMQEWAKRQAENRNKPPKKPIPATYTKADTTPLKATIESSGTKLELKIRKS